jgi:hypothetical protein
MLNRKRNLRRKWLRSGRPVDCPLAERLSSIMRDCQKLQRRDEKTQTDSLHDLLVNDPSKIFSLLKSKNKSREIITLRDDSGTLITDPSLVSDRFCSHQMSLYDNAVTPDVSMSPTPPSTKTNHPSVTNFISPEDVQRAIKEFKPTHSTGPDGIPPVILKVAGHLLVKPLVHIFNSCISSGRFPSMWKKGHGLPIHKSGSKHEVANYRIIVILCAPAMLFEKIMVAKLSGFLPRSFPSDTQHGFTRGKSTVTNLAEFAGHAHDAIENRSQLDTIYFDISKAFDIMSHSILLSELRSHGIPPVWVDFVSNYMSGRMFSISVNGVCSDSRVTPNAGVAQGSATGPFLFTVLIDPLARSILYSLLKQFADDCKIFRRINSILDAELLQSDILKILEWFSCHGLKVNTSKTKMVTYTRRTKPIVFVYRDASGAPIEKVHSIKDLGITFDSKMLFHEHTANVRLKALRLIGGLRSIMTEVHDKKIYALVAKSILIPMLTYGSVAWNHLTQADINKLNVTINTFCRLARHQCSEFHQLTTSTVKNMLGLQGCITRYLDQSDILFLHDLIHSKIDSVNLTSDITLSVPVHLQRTPHQLLFHANPTSLKRPIPRAMMLFDRLGLDPSESRARIIKHLNIL